MQALVAKRIGNVLVTSSCRARSGMGCGRTELKNESKEALTRLLVLIIKDDLSAKVWEITYLYDGISEQCMQTGFLNGPCSVHK